MLASSILILPLFLSITVFSLPLKDSRSLRARKAASFQAESSINVAGIYKAVKAAKSDGLARFSSGPGTNDVEIYGDWTDLTGDDQPIYTFMADMDIDCDGSYADQCLNDPSGQEETSWGHLDASKVPWLVIPISFREDHSNDLLPNSLGAVICNNKMYYAIYGDENGSTPEVIGEASLLLGQTCYPEDGIDADSGHEARDVAYIVFGKQVPRGVGDKTVDTAALKALGDEQVALLQDALGL